MIVTKESVLDMKAHTFTGWIDVICDGDEDAKRLFNLLAEIIVKCSDNAAIKINLAE